MNWTSTTVLMWQIDLDNYRKAGIPFQLKDVTTEEHRFFVKLFCARYGLRVTMAANTAIFSPDLEAGAAPVSSKMQAVPLSKTVEKRTKIVQQKNDAK